MIGQLKKSSVIVRLSRWPRPTVPALQEHTCAKRNKRKFSSYDARYLGMIEAAMAEKINHCLTPVCTQLDA